MKGRIGIAVQVFMIAVWFGLAAFLLLRHSLFPGLVALVLGSAHVGIVLWRQRGQGQRTGPRSSRP